MQAGLYGIPNRNYSQLSFNTYAGTASSNTTCGYFTNQHVKLGSAMTVISNDSVSGLDILINEDGVYSFDGAIPHVALQNCDVSITRNAIGADLGTGPQSLPWGKRLLASNQRQASSATPAAHFSGTHVFLAGDHIRFQDGGITIGTADYGYFNITKVS